jgi:hypothetical protein
MKTVAARRGRESEEARIPPAGTQVRNDAFGSIAGQSLRLLQARHPADVKICVRSQVIPRAVVFIQEFELVLPK